MKEKKSVNIILEILMWIVAISVIYPLLMVIMTSLKTKAEANVLSITPPAVPQFGNYAEVWEKGKITTSLINSLSITLVSVFFILLFSSILSFILVRRPTKLNRFISKFLTLGIIVPFAAMPTIKLLQLLNLHGTRTSLILVYIAMYLPFSTMLFSSFIKGIPIELDEAAVIDGCRGFELFRKIIFPLLKPVTATTGILNFMWVWNDFQTPVYLLNSADKWTLPVSVYNFYGTFQRDWSLVSADMILVSIPVILLYLFAQKWIISGMTSGAVKG